MALSAPPAVRRLDAPTEAEVEALAGVLLDCVAGGASIGFMATLDRSQARDFWRGVGAEAAAGRRVLLVAEDAGGIVGTVQLVPAQPANQPHRADLAKMLVHRSARRRGTGAALLHAAEAEARRLGRHLLVLDTGSPEAERLYERHGWQRCGTVPGFALWPHGGPCDTTFFYRAL